MTDRRFAVEWRRSSRDEWREFGSEVRQRADVYRSMRAATRRAHRLEKSCAVQARVVRL